MSSLDRVFSGLYAAVNRDPQPVPALTLALTPLGGAVPSSYWVKIADDQLTGTAQIAQAPQGPPDPAGYTALHQNLSLDLSTIGTLGQLAAYLNTLPGFSALLAPGANAQQAATALVEGTQDILASPTLSTYGSLLWALMKPVAMLLRRAQVDDVAGFAESKPATAYGLFLSDLGDLYGYDRYAHETDDQYRTRLLYEVIAPRCNNIAMEEYLRWSLALAQVSVTDDPTTAFRFLVNLQLQPGGGFSIPLSRITTILDRIKAWGVTWLITLTGADSELWDVTTRVLLSVAYRQQFLPESFTVQGAGEAFASFVRQAYPESARVPANYLTTNTWKNGLSQVISDTNDTAVTTLGAARNYKSWVQSLTDVWRTVAEMLTASTSWNATTATSVQAFRVAQTENAAGWFARIAEALAASVNQHPLDSPPPRWRVFRTNVRHSLTNDLNHSVGATPSLTGGGFAVSAGDPSWYVTH